MPFSSEIQDWSKPSNWMDRKQLQLLMHHCLLEILQVVNVKGLMLHHDNASSHMTKLTVKFLDQKHVKVTEHPRNILDLALCDFLATF